MKVRHIRWHKLHIFLVLFILLLFHGLNNYYLLTKSRYCLGGDSIYYFWWTNHVFQMLAEIKLNLKSLCEIYGEIFEWHFKPPLFFVTASPFLLFGIDKNILIMSNMIYFTILLFATYGIGKKLYNFEVGVFSAFLVSIFPTVFSLSRVLMVDFALTAMVALTFYLFVLNKFENFKFSLLTGLVIGLGSLTKQSYFIFLLPILFYFFLQKDNLKNKKRVRNFIFSIILGLLIAATYYTRARYSYYWVIFQHKSNIDPFFYFHSLLDRQLLQVFFALFLISLFSEVLKRKCFLPIMVFIPLIIFSISPNKTGRFILPVFPYIAVMVVGLILSLPKFRRISVIILVLFSLLQYFTISYGNISSNFHNSLQKILSGLHGGCTDEFGLPSTIDEGDWVSPGEEIIKIINDNFEQNKMDREIKVFFFPGPISNRVYTTIAYLGIIKKLPIDFACGWFINENYDNRIIQFEFEFARGWFINENYENHIIQFDFILEGVFSKNMGVHTADLSNAFKRDFDKFNFIKTISFPDNSICNIYKNKGM